MINYIICINKTMQKSNIMPALTLQSWFLQKNISASYCLGKNISFVFPFSQEPPSFFYWIVRQQNIRDVDEFSSS